MCIRTSAKPQVVKNGVLKLWKVIRKDNIIGIWGETERGNQNEEAYLLGFNHSHPFRFELSSYEGQFHCFFTRKDARSYRKKHQILSDGWGKTDPMAKTKVIRVYADSSYVVKIGSDFLTNARAISVSKMEIKSLNHQR